MGDLRLKVSNDRSYDHYCIECAKAIFAKDIEKLRQGFAAIEIEKIEETRNGKILVLPNVP